MKEKENSSETPLHPVKQKFFSWPRTKLGLWATILLGIHALFSLLISGVLMRLSFSETTRQSFFPSLGIVMMLFGLAAGIVGLLAVVKSHDRSFFVWLAMVAGLLVIMLFLGEFLIFE